MKIDRLLTILMMMVNRKKVTAKELAEYFEVSVRTIQRDMETLEQSGVPIYADVGKNGGYQLIETYKINKNFINIDEGKILVSILKSLEETLPSTDVKSVYNKMVSVVPEEKHEEKLVLKINPVMENSIFKEHLKAIAIARDENKKVNITYVDASLKMSKRIIEPYTLVMLGPVWYVYGYCCLRLGFRMFKLNRIDECNILEETFQRREFTEELPWEREYNSNRESTKIKLEIDISQKDKLPEYFSYKDCTIDGDKIKVEINYPVDEWVYSLFAGLIPHIKIIEPSWVRDEFVKRLKISLEKNIL